MLDPESSTLSKAFVCSQLAYNQGIPVRFRTYEPPSAKKIASPSPVSLHPSISSALSPSSTSLLPSPPIDLSPSPSLLFSNPVNRLPYSPLLLCSPLVDSLPIVSLPENDSVVPTSAVPADPWNEYRDIRIWEAARATTAAPSYFPPMGIIRGNEKRTFIDGAMGCNNPSLELVDEATALYGTGRVLGCLISLGTGFSGPLTIGTRKGPGRFWDLIKNIKRLSSDPESVHLGMESQIRPELNTYFRFQLPNGAESIGLHQYKKLDKLSRFMEKYIQDESSEITRSDHGQISTLRKHTPHWIPSNEYTTRPDFMNTLRGLSRRHRLESADSSLRLQWYFARLWTSQDAALPRIYEGIFEKWYSATY